MKWQWAALLLQTTHELILKELEKQYRKYSKKYEGYVDILEALLDDDKLYTSEEVDSLISTFMKRSVN